MPKNATFEEQVKWHQEPDKNCPCHSGFPKKLLEEIKKSKIKRRSSLKNTA